MAPPPPPPYPLPPFPIINEGELVPWIRVEPTLSDRYKWWHGPNRFAISSYDSNTLPCDTLGSDTIHDCISRCQQKCADNVLCAGLHLRFRDSDNRLDFCKLKNTQFPTSNQYWREDRSTWHNYYNYIFIRAPPSPPTSPPLPCVTCLNTPHPDITAAGYDCTTQAIRDWIVSDLIDIRCNRPVWINNRYCDLTCEELGYPYQGGSCCSSPPPPPPPHPLPPLPVLSEGGFVPWTRDEPTPEHVQSVASKRMVSLHPPLAWHRLQSNHIAVRHFRK